MPEVRVEVGYCRAATFVSSKPRGRVVRAQFVAVYFATQPLILHPSPHHELQVRYGVALTETSDNDILAKKTADSHWVLHGV